MGQLLVDATQSKRQTVRADASGAPRKDSQVVVHGGGTHDTGRRETDAGSLSVRFAEEPSVCVCVCVCVLNDRWSAQLVWCIGGVPRTKG